MTTLISSVGFPEQYFFRVREDTHKITCDVWTPEHGLLTNCPVDLSEAEPFIPPSLRTTKEKVKWLVDHHHFKPFLRSPKTTQKKSKFFFHHSRKSSSHRQKANPKINRLFAPLQYHQTRLNLPDSTRKEIYFSHVSPQHCELIKVRSIPVKNSEVGMLQPLTSELLILNTKPLILCNWKTGKIWRYENPNEAQVFLWEKGQVLVFIKQAVLAIWDLQTEQSCDVPGVDTSWLSFVKILSDQSLALGYTDRKVEVRDKTFKLTHTAPTRLEHREKLNNLIFISPRYIFIEISTDFDYKSNTSELRKFDLENKRCFLEPVKAIPNPSRKSCLFSFIGDKFLWAADEAYIGSSAEFHPLAIKECKKFKKISDHYALILGTYQNVNNQVILINVQTHDCTPLENAADYFDGDITISGNIFIISYKEELFWWDIITGSKHKIPQPALPSAHDAERDINFTIAGLAKFIPNFFILAKNFSYSYSPKKSAEWKKAMLIKAYPQAGASITIFNPEKSGKEGTYAAFNYEAPTTIGGIADLDNGCIAVRMHDSIEILAPQINKADANSLKIKKSPADFEPFKQLAKDYLQNEKDEEAYRVYLAAFSNALSFNHNFIARKFFSKALRIKPKTSLNSKVAKIKQEIHQKKLDTISTKSSSLAVKIKRIRLEAELKKLGTKIQNENHRSLEPYQLYLHQTKDNQEHRFIFQQLVQFYCRQGDEAKRVEYEKKLKDSPPRLRKRLLLGEGNFSYTDSLLKKHRLTHPNLATAITATEIDNQYYTSYKSTIDQLRKKGVVVLYGVDAATIDICFKGKRFERIHWNCPFIQPKESLRKLICGFFQAAHSLQLTGDRIHMALAINGKDQKPDEYYAIRQTKYYNIVSATTAVGYRLIGKRRFDKERYPDYTHAKTGKKESFDCLKHEFIFEKVNLREKLEIPSRDITSEAEKLENPEKKRYSIKYLEKQGPYFECSTDEDTSDYEASTD